MAQGKFSTPRPHRDEERQIEEAFRQVTRQQTAPRRKKQSSSEEEQIERAYRQFAGSEGAAHQMEHSEKDIPPESAPQQPVDRQPVMDEDAQIEQAFQQVTGHPIQKPTPAPQKQKAERLRQNLESFFDGGDFACEEEEAAPQEREPDFVDNMQNFLQKAMDFCGKNQKLVAITACGIAVVLICFILGMFVAGASDPYDGRILNNVYIADISVGGMKQEEAVSAVKQAMGSSYESSDMVIDLSGRELRLSPKDTDASLDVKSAVEEAYNYGRTGTQEERDSAYEASRTQPYIIDILPHLGLDTNYIQKTLTDYAQDSGSTLTQTSYGLEGDEPELAAEKFDKNAPTQTLVITLGTPGIGFDAKAVYEQVLVAYSSHVFLVTVEDIQTLKDPDPIDLEQIYQEFYIEPVDASVNTQNFKTIPGSYGYEFDLEAAQKLLDKAEFGDTIRIPMQYIEPEILDADAFFRDTLGEYQTRHSSSASRTSNLQLACKAIHNTVLMPGESLSFSSKLASVQGFAYAPEDTGMEDTPQGGASQVASTLYNAALQAELEITSRSNLGFVPSFTDPGLDAAASLKLRNNQQYPVRIEASVSGGYVKVNIIGTDERDYYVRLGYEITNTYEPETEYQDFEYNNAEGFLDGDVLVEGITGYLVKTYKVKYDSATGNRLSSDFIANSQYPVTNRLVARVEPEPTTVPTEAPTQPTETVKPTETTPATTEAATVPKTTEATAASTQAKETSPVPETQVMTTAAAEANGNTQDAA